MAEVAHIVMGGPGYVPANKPVAVFTNMNDVRRITGRENGLDADGIYETWGAYRVVRNVPLNPVNNRIGGRKTRRKTRRH